MCNMTLTTEDTEITEKKNRGFENPLLLRVFGEFGGFLYSNAENAENEWRKRNGNFWRIRRLQR